MRTFNFYNISEDDVSKWIALLSPYEGYRNCIIAHSSLKKPHVPSVDYKIFIEMLDQFEIKLEQVKQLISDHRLVNGVWSVPNVDPENLILLELRNLLSCS